MSHILVKFVEDGIYHVCPKAHVRTDSNEIGLVSAKYKGSFFRAAVICEGDKPNMETLKERCILSDNLSRRYKIQSPCNLPKTNVDHSLVGKNVRKSLFPSKRTSRPASTDIDYSTTTSTITSSPSESTQTTKSKECCSLPLTKTVFKHHPSPAPIMPEASVSDDNANPTTHLTQRSKPDYIINDPDYPTSDDASEGPVEGTATNVVKDSFHTNDCHENLRQKKYYCPYCRNMYKKIARHFFQVHSGEPEISEIINLKPRDPERLRVLNYLRSRGSKVYNKLLKSPEKTIIPRSKGPFKKEQYLDCYLCGNMYKSKFLYRHVRRCPLGDGSSASAKRKAVRAAHAVADEASDAIKFHQDVLSGIRDETIKEEIAGDEVLREYGKYLCSLYANDVHLINLIRRKLREVAVVLIEMKRMENRIESMRDVLQPKNKHIFFSAVKTVTGYDKGAFQRPAMAKNLMALFDQCAKRLICSSIEAGDEPTRINVKRWLDIVRTDYNAIIAKVACRNLDENKWNKPRTLPLTEDIFKLNKYVEKMANEAMDLLKQEFSLVQWTRLVKATIVKLIVFNRKRVGDVQRMRIEDFKNIHNIQKNSVTFDMLSESEKLISSQYMRMESRGKHAKVITVLMTKVMVQQINTVILHRSNANVDETNPFIFGKQQQGTFSASTVLKEMSYDIKATNPEFITGTKLRKQIATASQAFNFTQNDLSILAGFLGHNLQTHSEFYRLPDEATQLAKISKVLEAIDSGRVGELKGKSLDELDSYVTRMIEEQDQSADVAEDESPGPSHKTKKECSKTTKRPTIIRKSWSTPEKKVMRHRFKHHLQNYTLPTPLECYELKSGSSPLKGRTVNQIKAWVNNQNVKELKKKLS